ncbi:hypothetical protein M3Y94_00342800 [Aphelenchoides besseyi]|nr:hypothetical protein M3Y94_00342800 [Aphelenchoides besseyi]
MSAAQKIQHSAKNMLFYMNLNGSKRAVLEYRQLKDNVIDMYHTEVPKEMRGQGIAQKLAKEAFNFCKENQLKVVTSCPYVQKYANEIASESEKKLVIQKLGDSHVSQQEKQ